MLIDNTVMNIIGQKNLKIFGKNGVCNMSSVMKTRRTLKILIFPISVLLLLLLLSFKIINSKNQKNEEGRNYHSEFYNKMGKDNVIDFIKNGEVELKNLDKYLEDFKDDILFCDFLTTQRNCLRNEIINKKHSLDSKKALKNSKTIEYETIDYINLYKQYCIDHYRVNKFKEFCDRYGIGDNLSPYSFEQEDNKTK